MPWFPTHEWIGGSKLRIEKRLVPKLQFAAIEEHWEEYEVLKLLRAKKFTLATTRDSSLRPLEFDKSFEGLRDLCKLIQSDTASEEPVLPILRPTGTVDGKSQFSSWEEIDVLYNKTIPIYNYVRNYFISRNYFIPQDGNLLESTLNSLTDFPIATKSKGKMIHQCGFCYLAQSHCGNHSIPIQSTELISQGVDSQPSVDVYGVSKFEAMSYVEMRAACREVASRIRELESQDEEFLNTFSVIQHLKGDELHIDTACNPWMLRLMADGLAED